MVVLIKLKKIDLKKLKAASLVETLVATVIIVLLFSIASLTLNNIFSNTIKNNTNKTDTQLNYLQYLYLNNQVKIPYQDSFGNWDIEIKRTTLSTKEYISFEAVHVKHKKRVTKKIIDVISQ